MNFKIRNRLIALSCFLLFIAIGATFLFSHAIQKPFGIILFIGDGMSPSLLTATRLYEGGADYRLALEDFPHTALTRTYGNDFAVPDAASAATAIATGHRVNHQSLGIDSEGKFLPTLIEEAANEGRAVGIVSSGTITGETAAAFYAKTLNSRDQEANAIQLLKHSSIDLLFGGGSKYFTSTKAENNNEKNSSSSEKDPSKNLLEALNKKGYIIVNNSKDLASIPTWKSSPIIALLAENDLHDFSTSEETSPNSIQPSLPDLVREAIERLQYHRHGYFLIVDAALIAKAASLNNAEKLFQSILQFDQAIAIARQYAGPKSLIFVTGKQNLGGLRMNGYPFRNDKGVAVLGINAQGAPSITWSTGPGHNTTTPSNDNNKENPSILAEPSSFIIPSALGVAEDTVTLGIGPGSEELSGFIDLTSIYHLIKKEL
ncbi:MAG: hypothetical protein A3F67_04600 [Verrucomicrobia bacterium RIFCSPHIGHO2_12_FULL_41_10]|nr:MAG: hypothetical protein A3F67_04600 [Verrucomicrobia bacterium RIFCSPHIGHO2_12_FULL_41_10]HLB33769.1 alkaline phosphatase [Chthoniobacterales bacterium]